MTLVNKVDSKAFEEFLKHINDPKDIPNLPVIAGDSGNALSFDVCFERLISHEAGYVNNPKDPGGETKWGISKRSYPKLDIKNLTREQAKIIYKVDFWDVVTRGTSLASSVMYQLFDFAVNSGIENAIRYLQRTIGVADDGDWGPVSQLAASNMEENDMLLIFLAERLEFMTKLTNWPNASRGWARRIAQNMRYAALDNKRNHDDIY